MRDFLTVFGNGGQFKVSLDTGSAYEHEPSSDVPTHHEGYQRIIWVDLEEWRKFWGKPLYEYLDILDCRVMRHDGTFEEAEADWRKDIQLMNMEW